MYYIQPKDIEELEQTIRSIQQSSHPNCLLIVRGLPGMGKSYLASLIANKYYGIHYESDQKFTTGGVYKWDGSKVQAAHEITRHDVKLCMLQHAPMIILSNTSTMKWEYEPYIQMAGYYQYTTIVYDLYGKVVEYMKDSLPLLNRTESNIADLKSQYIDDFLSKNNVHEVPNDRIHIMSDRYQFQSEIIEIIVPPSTITTAVDGDVANSTTDENVIAETTTDGQQHVNIGNTPHQQKYLEVYDSGYYLGILVNVADDLTHDHSPMFWACIFACHELMKVFGISSAFNMIRKLINRNLASSEFRNRNGNNNNSNSSDIKKLMKLNAGWAKYHITILSPPEYDAMKSQGVLNDFIARLQALPLDQINDQFKSLVPSQGREKNVGMDESSFTSSLAYQQLIDHIGMLQGEILDKNAAPARLDQFASTLLNTHTDNNEAAVSTNGESSTAATVVGETSSTSPCPLLLSSTFYLLLDKTAGVLQEVDELRTSFLQSGSDSPIAEWTPHITLAFTHNDIHEKIFNGPAGQSSVMSRSSGIYSFQQIRQLALRKRKQLADEEEVENSSEGDNDEDRMEIGSTLPLTDLEEDAPYPFFAELSVHSEVNATFSYAYSFIICDLKIRKGPFGDDESYRTHGVLMKLLPRGLVILQHQVTRTIYRGLFSLKKFYGKEGMEDDGFGMNAGELNFKLHQHMKKAEYVMLMEKVNGRAGSCRFFRYGKENYVIVGTKLAHTIGKIDRSKNTIVLSDEFSSFSSSKASSGTEEGENALESLEDLEDVLNNGTKGGKIDYEKIQFNRNHLIYSNVTALIHSIKWEHFEEMLQWFGGCTINGEILDPDEMHLVIIDQLQWVVLCTTTFPVEEFDFSKKGMTMSRQLVDSSEEDVTANSSLITTLQSFNKYFQFTPQYQLYKLQDIIGDETKEEDIIPRKIQKTMELAKSLIYERCSEGKVLYLLDGKSRVLEMMKYKTWWYIYRRSIREIVSKLLQRYFSPSDANANKDNNNKSKRPSSVEDQLVKLRQFRDQLSKAKNLSTNAGLQAKIQALNDQIQQLENPVVEVTLSRPPLRPLVDEIAMEIKNRWPNKFNFLKNEMNELYEGKTAVAIDLAQKFVEFMHDRLQRDEREVVVKFRKHYPLLWEDFLQERNISNDV